MMRPQTVQEVFEALGNERLVEPVRLAAFAERHARDEPAAALARLVADGLLTAFQAAEVASGNGAGLWLGSYRVLDRLGRGGMGSVFLAEHAVLGKRVAVKVLSDALRSDPDARKRFTREARAAAALAHPNIVTVLGADMAHDPPFLVMEHVDGLSLQEAVARAGAFGPGEVAAVAVQVADGLARAAAVGLVHRDIKPANLLIDRRGAVKILDLGIAKFTQDGAHSQARGAEVILGTLDYLAPEQAVDSSEVDTRADLYALGATLYFLLTGHPPHPGTDVRWKLRAKQTCDPHPLDQLRPDVEPELAAAVHRLLARDRNDRFPTPADVGAAFRPWAVTGPGFPGRLFKAAAPSTAADGAPPAPEAARDPLPDTLLIVKTKARTRTEMIPLSLPPAAPA
ncbi:MAG TPA: serine/threonine-protein kinase, partial [Gemmata sp.]